jgi:Uri superfamily endonuclease
MATAENILLSRNLTGRFLDQSRGSYVILIKLPEEQTITIGSLNDICFSGGFYAYVGSAMGGIKSRLGYHLKRGKKRHWHIDYLLEEATIVGISICETKDRSECAIARVLSSQFDSISGFGSSDCRCRSHLFFDTDEGRLRGGIKAAIASLALSFFEIGRDPEG